MSQLPANGPTAEQVKAYVGTQGASWSVGIYEEALAAEAIDQANRCRFPVNQDGEPVYDAALREALCRRVAHNLAVRAVPLGVQVSISEMTAVSTYVGGTDAEVRRLEAPYRKRKVG